MKKKEIHKINLKYMYSFSECSQCALLCTYLLDFLPTRFHTYWFFLPTKFHTYFFIPTWFPTYWFCTYYISYLPHSPPRGALLSLSSLSLGCSLRRSRCRCGRPLALRLLAVCFLCGSFLQLVKLLVHLLQFPESHKFPSEPSTFLHAAFNNAVQLWAELTSVCIFRTVSGPQGFFSSARETGRGQGQGENSGNLVSSRHREREREREREKKNIRLGCSGFAVMCWSWRNVNWWVAAGSSL